MNQQTTPKILTPAVLAFCMELSPGRIPVYLDVQPTPDALPLQCFFNVADLVRDFGGAAHYGWSLYEWTGVLIQAEHHAVWEHPDGRGIIDPTPNEGDWNKTLFVPNADMTFDGNLVATRRTPLSMNKKVRRYVEARNTQDRLLMPVQREPMLKIGRVIFDLYKMSPTVRTEYEQAVATWNALHGRMQRISRNAHPRNRT